MCRTIIGQQLAGKAASAIFKRFDDLFEGKITPNKILLIVPQQMRDVGLSWAKVRSIIDLATKVINKNISLDNLPNLEDEKVIEELIKVKGIGKWTAEIFLMFKLRRENIFSWGDLGLKNGLKKYIGQETVSVEEMTEIVEKWNPYKTFGAIAMWQILDNK